MLALWSRWIHQFGYTSYSGSSVASSQNLAAEVQVIKDRSVAPYSAQYLTTFFPRNLTPGCRYRPMHSMSATTLKWSCDSCGPSMPLISPIFPYHFCSWTVSDTTSAITHEFSLSALNTDKNIRPLTMQLGSIYHPLWRIPQNNDLCLRKSTRSLDLWMGPSFELLLHRRSIWNTQL